MTRFLASIRAFAITVITVALVAITGPGRSGIASEICIDRLARQIDEAEVVGSIVTLDGQEVLLEEFYRACERQGSPMCVLFEKFYYWPSEVRTTTSISRKGRVPHTIRVYYNPASICFPERVNPARIYGDVAEFYDDCGEFMGIVVYMGEGVYFPLPFSGYSKRDWTFSGFPQTAEMGMRG
jgi:hypothetical protein